MFQPGFPGQYMQGQPPAQPLPPPRPPPGPRPAPPGVWPGYLDAIPLWGGTAHYNASVEVASALSHAWPLDPYVHSGSTHGLQREMGAQSPETYIADQYTQRINGMPDPSHLSPETCFQDAHELYNVETAHRPAPPHANVWFPPVSDCEPVSGSRCPDVHVTASSLHEAANDRAGEAGTSDLLPEPPALLLALH